LNIHLGLTPLISLYLIAIGLIGILGIHQLHLG